MESEHLKSSTVCRGHGKATVTVAHGEEEEDSEGFGDPWAVHALPQTGSAGAASIFYRVAQMGDSGGSDHGALLIPPTIAPP